MTTLGICFSPDKSIADPLEHIGSKRPVYDRLLDMCIDRGWRTFIFTRKTYLGNSVFAGAWEYKDKKLTWTDEKIKADLVYDRTGGVKFPLQGETLQVVNVVEFKLLCWDKWAAHGQLSDFMPQTFSIENMDELPVIADKIRTDWFVVKPFNGLQGKGIYIGPKDGYKNFEFDPKYKRYVVQEFVDTSKGVKGIVGGMHDIRVAVVNGKPVWGHVRVPAKGKYTSNAAGGGILTELNLELLSNSIMDVVAKVSKDFYERFDNPIFSLDFGMDISGKPFIFEINDQIGFPRWEMQQRDTFLKELIANFESKL
ncbi:MAG: hypothetical protein AAB546_03070 [Patescibacteria group bacterium]